MSESSVADCSICLCPLSANWGVAAPCGHPFHRDCWDQLVAASQRGGGRRKKPACPICKGASNSFVPVYVDLGNNDSEQYPKADDGGIIDLDGCESDEVDGLIEKWDIMWSNFERLCNEDRSSDDQRAEDGSVAGTVDLLGDDEIRGRSEVTSIFNDLIDLTQQNSTINDADDIKTGPVRLTDRLGDISDDAKLLRLEEKHKSILAVTVQLKDLHERIMGAFLLAESTPSSTSSGRQAQKLRKRVLSMQAQNRELADETCSLREKVTLLSSKMEATNQNILQRTLELEKEKRLHESTKAHYNGIEESFRTSLAKGAVEKKALENSLASLRTEFENERSRNGLRDMDEMSLMVRKYRKMSQEHYDLQQKNLALERRDRDLQSRLEREKIRYSELKTQLDEWKSASRPALIEDRKKLSTGSSPATRMRPAKTSLPANPQNLVTKQSARSMHRLDGRYGLNNDRLAPQMRKRPRLTVDAPSAQGKQRSTAMDALLGAPYRKKFSRQKPEKRDSFEGNSVQVMLRTESSSKKRSIMPPGSQNNTQCQPSLKPPSSSNSQRRAVVKVTAKPKGNIATFFS